MLIFQIVIMEIGAIIIIISHSISIKELDTLITSDLIIIIIIITMALDMALSGIIIN